LEKEREWKRKKNEKEKNNENGKRKRKEIKKEREKTKLPKKRTSLPKKVQKGFIPVHVAEIIFAANQYNWCIRTKLSNLRIPDYFAIFQGHWVGD